MALPAPTSGSISLITGASSGLGVEIAKELAKRGRSLALVARRQERLDEIAASLREDYGVRVEPIGCDISDGASRDALFAHLAELGLVVDVLVNNAGYGSIGRFQDLPPADEIQMVRVNVEAVVALCAATAPAMAARRGGGVLNVASLIAFQPVPGSTTYSATKAFVLAFSEALHTDLSPAGVTVTALCPGMMRTEFLDRPGLAHGATRLPQALWIEASAVARDGVRALERGDRVCVPGLVNRASASTGRHMPHWMSLRVLDRMLNAN